MARMKFLCDADRCIECNACVTACKNENEVPWGINRRRVVTINDGKPGERSVSMACMHCTDRAVRGGLPGELLLHDRRRGGAAFQGPLHRLRLLLLRLPVRRAAISARRQFRLARQDGQVHLLHRRPGGGRLGDPVREVRRQSPVRRQAAAVRGNVLDEVACSRATATSLRKFTRTAWPSAVMAPALGGGRPPIARPSRPETGPRRIGGGAASGAPGD